LDSNGRLFDVPGRGGAGHGEQGSESDDCDPLAHGSRLHPALSACTPWWPGASDLYYRMRRVTGLARGRPGHLSTEVHPVATTSEEESRKVAEESREQEWAGRTF